MYAAASNLVDACSTLLDAGALINSTDLDGCTALHIAYIHGSSSAVSFLEANGADCDALNKKSKVPFETSGSIEKYPPLFFKQHVLSKTNP